MCSALGACAIGIELAAASHPVRVLIWATVPLSHTTVSAIGRGRGCNIFFPVLGGNGTRIAPTGDILD